MNIHTEHVKTFYTKFVLANYRHKHRSPWKVTSRPNMVLACVFAKSGGGKGEVVGNHTQVKIAKLHCKSAGPCLCQSQLGGRGKVIFGAKLF